MDALLITDGRVCFKTSTTLSWSFLYAMLWLSSFLVSLFQYNIYKQFLPHTWNFPSKMVISSSHAHITDFPSLVLTVGLWVILEFISIFWLFFFYFGQSRKTIPYTKYFSWYFFHCISIQRSYLCFTQSIE